MTLRGIDISEHQGWTDSSYDYELASLHTDFVYAKVSQWLPTSGRFYNDHHYEQARAGFSPRVPFGSYLWFSPGDGRMQAEHFIWLVGDLRPGELPPMVDVEEEGVDPFELWECIQTLEKRYGLPPWVYGGAVAVANKPLLRCARVVPQIALYPLWVASYGRRIESGPGVLGAPFEDWLVWQYTSSGSIPGIADPDIDVNIFKGDHALLNSFRFEPDKVPPVVPNPTPASGDPMFVACPWAPVEGGHAKGWSLVGNALVSHNNTPLVGGVPSPYFDKDALFIDVTGAVGTDAAVGLDLMIDGAGQYRVVVQRVKSRSLDYETGVNANTHPPIALKYLKLPELPPPPPIPQIEYGPLVAQAAAEVMTQIGNSQEFTGNLTEAVVNRIVGKLTAV